MARMINGNRQREVSLNVNLQDDSLALRVRCDPALGNVDFTLIISPEEMARVFMIDPEAEATRQ